MLGASEGAFGVDVPVVSEQGSQPGGEGFGVSEGLQVAMEAELALPEVAFAERRQTCRERRDGAPGWEERSVAWMEPNGCDRATIRRRAPHNGHAGDVRVFDSRCGAR